MTKCHGLELKDSHNENNVGYEQNNTPNDHTPVITGDDTPYKQNDDTPHIKFVHTPTSLQASDSLGLKVEGGVIANDYTPVIARDDTNILRVNNINNNIRAREFDEPSYVINLVNNKSEINESTTNCHRLELTDPEEQKSICADNAFGFLTEPTQSAFIATKYLENNYLP